MLILFDHGTIQELRVYVTSGLNQTPFINNYLNTLPQTIYQLVTVTHTNSFLGLDAQVVFSALLVMVIICFASVYTRDWRQHTDAFNLITPEPFSQDNLIKGVWSIVFFNLLIIGTLTLSALIVAGLRSLPLGSLATPITSLVTNSTQVTTVMGELLRWLMFFNLWLILIAMLTCFLSQFVKQSTALIALLLVIVFANQLNLLQLVPEKMRAFIPTYYTSSFDYIAHQAAFSLHKPSFVITSFIISAGGLASTTLLIQSLRYHGVFNQHSSM